MMKMQDLVLKLKQKLCKHDYEETDRIFINRTLYNKKKVELTNILGTIRFSVVKTCSKCNKLYSYDDVLDIPNLPEKYKEAS